jgi:hypothetical protein
LISAIRRAERILERFDDLGLESGGDPQGAALIVGGDQLVDLLRIVARHRRQQIPADPFPDRSQRTAQYPSRIGLLRSPVDQQWLQWCEEIAGSIAGASLGRFVGAEFRAQRGHDLFGARHFLAAGFQPFELGQKIAARGRRQLRQILLNPTGLYHRERDFRSLTRDRRPIGRAVVRPCTDATTKTVCAGLRSNPMPVKLRARAATSKHFRRKLTLEAGRTFWANQEGKPRDTVLHTSPLSANPTAHSAKA